MIEPLRQYGSGPVVQLRPFFCFYGGKWRAAPRYPFPRHDTIVEPFAGAAGYATRYPLHRVTLVERDPLIAALWRYLIAVDGDEVMRIPLLAHDQTVDDLHVCEEARHLVGFWLNKGSAQPKRTPSAWMRAGKHASSFWGREIRLRVAMQVRAIKHWKLIEGSYENAPRERATYFVDPPYDGDGKHYRYSEIDYPALGAWVRDLPGFVIACENDGATWLPFKPFLKIKANESRSGGKQSAEAIYVQEDRAPSPTRCLCGALIVSRSCDACAAPHPEAA